MNSEPLFDDLIGVMAVITMVPVFFLWPTEDHERYVVSQRIRDQRHRLSNCLYRQPF